MNEYLFPVVLPVKVGRDLGNIDPDLTVILFRWSAHLRKIDFGTILSYKLLD